MKKQTKILIPSYVVDFKCIGGKCEDSCCIGWDIDIDKKSFGKYFRTKNKKMKQLFKKHINRNKESCNSDIDYGRIKIKDSKWCPFLNTDKLCEIYNNLGEDSLSNVCYSFPRVYNVLNGVYELSLSMSCPEAVRKLLSNKEPIKFIEQDMPIVKHNIHGYINTEDKYWKNSNVKRLAELRSLSLDIIKNRSSSIKERFLKLGFELKINDNNNSSLGDRGRDQIIIKDKYIFRLEFFKYVIESLGIIDNTDSPVFASFTKQIIKNFDLKGDKPYQLKADLYKKTVETIVIPFNEENGYVFEHFLVNFIYQDNFPFSENEDIFDGYVMLVVRYSLIQFYLAGIAIENKKLTIDDVAQIIQIHAKIINHHKTFILNLLMEIKRKEFDNLEIITMLLD